MDWFKGKSAGKPHISWENLWFPVNSLKPIQSNIFQAQNQRLVSGAPAAPARCCYSWAQRVVAWRACRTSRGAENDQWWPGGADRIPYEKIWKNGKHICLTINTLDLFIVVCVHVFLLPMLCWWLSDPFVWCSCHCFHLNWWIPSRLPVFTYMKWFMAGQCWPVTLWSAVVMASTG